MLRLIQSSVAVVALVGLLVYVTGCAGGDPEANHAPVPEAVAYGEGDEHEHAPGAHGGTIVPIGRESYHAEIVFEKEGVLRLFTLGADESKVQEAESQTLTAFAKEPGAGESSSFELKPEPQPGDAEGKTSQFVGQLPEELRGRPVEVTIPSLTINGERFRLGFASPEEEHEAHMPDHSQADDRIAQLFLTPGGLYTQADIEANGNTTAAEKFRGVKANHDLKPAPGDKICPITLTKANPEITWAIGGKTYEFCCPPCIEEFVALAKEQPDEIKAPEEYVKQP